MVSWLVISPAGSVGILLPSSGFDAKARQGQDEYIRRRLRGAGRGGCPE